MKKVTQSQVHTLPGGRIGRRGTIDWASRSPDLTPMDFFYGVLQYSVYNSVYNSKGLSLQQQTQ